ncbi:DUF3098 domain-containing protein [Prosthecochloris vibrioformis]|nr:DUF3098 domain-containing protein [Prosthecochloris vibrioformis]
MKSSRTKNSGNKPQNAPMPLGRKNYIFLAIGVGVLIVSYTGMYLEKSVDGFFSLNVAPPLLLAAYAWIAYAILYKEKET